MSEKERSYQKENAKLLEQAEKIAAQISIKLRFFYEDRVQIRDEHIELNSAVKVPYESLFRANTFGANNGMKGLMSELSNILNHVNEFYDGDIGPYKSDDISEEIYEGKLKTLEFWFEHICKWIAIEE